METLRPQKDVNGMFERFTDQARNSIIYATEEARRFKSDRMDSEHLLLGMFHDTKTVAGEALSSFDYDLESARERLLEVFGEGETVSGEHIPFAPVLKVCLDGSLREALQLGHNYVGTEHLLLALIRHDEGTCFHALGIDPAMLRRRIINVLQSRIDDARSEAVQPEQPAVRSSAEISAEIEALDDRMRELKTELNAAVKQETGCDPSWHH